MWSMFQMAYRDLVPVKIKGFAVLQQILLNLPRDRNFTYVPVEMQYDAIASLSPELYLKPKTSTPIPYWMPEEDELVCLMQPPPYFPDNFDYDWISIPLPDVIIIKYLLTEYLVLVL